jgi:signal transduction histidine kinase
VLDNSYLPDVLPAIIPSTLFLKEKNGLKNLKRFFVLLCLIFPNFNHLSAQEDSLLHVYHSAATPKDKANILLSLNNFYTRSYDSVHAKHYAREIVALAANQKDTAMLIKGANALGNIQHQFNDFKGSLFHHRQAFALAEASRSVEQMAIMKYNIGNDYLSMRDIGKALQSYTEGTEISKDCDCSKSKLYLNIQLADFYSENMRDNTTAILWGKRAWQYAEREKYWQLQIAKEIATFYLALNEVDSARYFADIAYERVQNSDNKGQKADILCVKSEVEAANGQSEPALSYALEAYKIGSELPDIGLKGRISLALGHAFLLRGDAEQAQKALLSAEKYITEARTTAHRLPKLYRLLATIAEVAEPKQAINYLRQAAIVQDSMNNATYNNQLAVFSMQTDNVLKEAENRQLKIEAENKEKRFRILLIPLAFVSVLLLGLLYLYRRIRAKNTELSRLNTLYNQQNNALTASNQRMEWFTQTLSHDALGYINNVLNFANFGKNASYSEEVTGILEKVHKNAVSLKKMSLNLILFKKTGEIANTSNISLTDVMAEVIEDMGEELTHNPLTLNALNLPMAYADKEFTKQIFRNLLNNAVKFRQPKGELHVSISGVEKGDFVEIQVRDNGVGIPEEKLSLVFDEFTRLNKKVEGSGLGLFICQQTVEVMGGKIWAEAVVEGGTTIHFTLPMAKNRDFSNKKRPNTEGSLAHNLA